LHIGAKLGLFFLSAVLNGCYMKSPTYQLTEKINGVSLEAGREVTPAKDLKILDTLGARWVAIIPYAFAPGRVPELHFNHGRQWRGETLTGVAEQISIAHEAGFKVMVKPHVWVRGDGWPGEFKLDTEEDWTAWEDNYTRYILAYLQVADSLNVELFCIGTEFNQAIIQRPDFWKKLSSMCREKFKGKLTYAANWDNYQHVNCWESLDYIGIDAYFPISDAKTPTLNQLRKGWLEPFEGLKELSERSDRPVLFTEYGYRSADFAAAGHWQLDEKEQPVNLKAQENAYEALFTAFWNQPWFAGGFLWKWYPSHREAGGATDHDYTPQNKPAEGIILKWYSSSSEVVPTHTDSK